MSCELTHQALHHPDALSEAERAALHQHLAHCATCRARYDARVDAALAGGFIAVGIGSEENLGHAQYVLPNFIGVSLQDILDGIKIKST